MCANHCQVQWENILVDYWAEIVKELSNLLKHDSHKNASAHQSAITILP